MSKDKSFSRSEKDGLYKAIFSRRDVRSHFISKQIPDETLAKILNAAHHAPSVGFSQPWNFILIKDDKTRQKVKQSFMKERKKSILMLDNDKSKQKKYKSLKLEGIMESPINICVTYDPTRFGPFVLGRTSISETGVYSVCCAIQNLWLAARVEGIGIGWVSILTNEALHKILSIPDHVRPVAYLCLGYASKFAAKPDLENAGWLKRIGLGDVISYEKWGECKTHSWAQFCDSVKDIR